MIYSTDCLRYTNIVRRSSAIAFSVLTTDSCASSVPLKSYLDQCSLRRSAVKQDATSANPERRRKNEEEEEEEERRKKRRGGRRRRRRGKRRVLGNRLPADGVLRQPAPQLGSPLLKCTFAGLPEPCGPLLSGTLTRQMGDTPIRGIGPYSLHAYLLTC